VPVTLILTIMIALVGFRAEAQQRTQSEPQLVAEGAMALQERRFDVALEIFGKAIKLRPQDSRAWLGQGVAEYMMGRNDTAETSLKRALSLEPRLADASVLLGQLQYTNGRLPDAIATYEAALKHLPGDPGLLKTLAKWRAEDQVESRFYESRGAHFRVRFEGPADDLLARRVVEMLEKAYWHVGGILSTYPPQTIEVILYTVEQFHDVTRSPAWAAAAYDGSIRVPARDALTRPGDLERLLTHELVHAFVTSLGGRSVPVWLNEGLAVALEPDGVEQSERALAATPTRVRLETLHEGFGRLSASRAYVAYAESAIAVKRMLNLRGAPAVATLLTDLANGADFATAFHQRMAMPYDDFQQLITQQ
jgi:Tfp pilus assembly protein PilF